MVKFGIIRLQIKIYMLDVYYYSISNIVPATLSNSYFLGHDLDGIVAVFYGWEGSVICDENLVPDLWFLTRGHLVG